MLMSRRRGLVGAIGLALLGVIDLSSTFPVFDALFLITVTCMATVAVRRFRHLAREQKVLLLTYGLFCGLLVVDMAFPLVVVVVVATR